MKTKAIVLFIIFNSLFFPIAKGQLSDNLPAGNTVWEELSLTTDRDLYLSGENIWFKAIVSIKNSMGNRQLSNVVYIELYQNKTAVLKKKFQLRDGTAEGMLSIPEEIPSANYYLRAYTQYQRNFPPETFFTTLLTIINPEIPPQKSKTRPVKLIEIVPEGGQVISGLPAVVALKINPKLLKMIKKSRLTDQYNDTIKDFQLAENGLALIEFTVVDTLDYYLKFILSNGDTVTEPIQKTNGKGIIISANNRKGEVNIYSDPAYRIRSKTEHSLLLYALDGQKKRELAIAINKTKQTVAFDDTSLEEGFYQLLLLNAAEEIVAQSTFYHPANSCKMDLHTQKKVFKPREKVQLTIGLEQENCRVLDGLSISVTKKGTVFLPDRELPLSIIENPLLLPSFTRRLNGMDTLMARQIKAVLILNHPVFNYRQLHKKSTEKPEWLPEIREVSLSGIARNKKTKKALPGVWVFVSVLGPDAQIHAYKTREDGSFVFSLNKLNNTHHLALTMDSIPGVETEFLIYNDFSNKWPVAKDVPLQIDSVQRLLLKSMFLNDQLSKVFKPKETLVEQTGDSLPFPFTDVQASIKLEDFVALPTMTEVINEVVPYLHVRNRNRKHVLTVVDQTKKNVFEHPLILVDNLPVFNVEEILAINPAKIESIDVIGKVYSYGDLLVEGIVMIHTKTDNFAGVQLPSASVFVEYQTITPSASVKFPVYNPQSETTAHNPDFKNLLYWNPSVPFTCNDTTITFYTADEMTNYMIVVSGKTVDGRPVFGQCEIRVE